MLFAVVGINYMPPIGGFRLPGELGKLVIHGTKITMQQPRLTGYTADSRAYEFSADAAAQDITKPDLVELDKLHAKMEMEDKSTVEMSADSGIYDVKTEMLTLDDNIELHSSTGYEGRLSEAVSRRAQGQCRVRQAGLGENCSTASSTPSGSTSPTTAPCFASAMWR